jgi:hypothetical protein
MDRYEYEISTHAADTFSRLVYFCSELGNCSLEEVPADEPQILVDLLNERGLEGWELIQLVFGKDGVMACWKRRIAAQGSFK